MSDLVISGLRKAYGRTDTLKGIDLELKHGEFLVLLGPSGCGKSTLLNCIAGLLEPSAGDIRIGGRSVIGVHPKDRDIAMVFQSYALYPNLDVARNIGFGLEMRRVPKAERQAAVERVAETLQITALLKRRPAELSGGQRQRVAIGRALVRNPAIFLFDEPLSNLDAKLRNDTRVELKHLHQRLAATTVYVTHDQHEAMTLATQVVLLKDGEIVQIAAPTELYSRPVNRFAATFIGSPAINLIRGEMANGRFIGGGMDVVVPPDAIGKPANGAVELGLRSENARITGETDAHQIITVDYVEPTGADLYVNGKAGDQDVVIRVERTARVSAGDKLPIRWQLEQGLIFDAESGMRL